MCRVSPRFGYPIDRNALSYIEPLCLYLCPSSPPIRPPLFVRALYTDVWQLITDQPPSERVNVGVGEGEGKRVVLGGNILFYQVIKYRNGVVGRLELNSIGGKPPRLKPLLNTSFSRGRFSFHMRVEPPNRIGPLIDLLKGVKKGKEEDEEEFSEFR